MKITFLLSSLWISGGVRVVIQYANRLIKRGFIVSFVIPNGTIDTQIRSEIDPRVQIITTRSKLNHTRNVLNLFRILIEMVIAVPKSDVIVATHTPTTAVCLFSGRVLKRGKLVWFYQDYQEMFEKRPIESWLIHNGLRWHDLAVTVSAVSVKELQSFSTGRMVNIGEGLDTREIFHPMQNSRPAEQAADGKKIIFSIGDPRPRKGMADFITAYEEAVKKHPNLILWLAAKDPIEVSTKLPYKFFARPNPAQMAQLYSWCDIFVSASWYESFGLPPLEAMACGAAVITTDSRGIREYAVDEENCLIVPPKKPDKLAEAILRLLSDPELADKLKKNGPETAARFDWEQATDRFEAALLSLVSNRHSY